MIHRIKVDGTISNFSFSFHYFQLSLPTQTLSYVTKVSSKAPYAQQFLLQKL